MYEQDTGGKIQVIAESMKEKPVNEVEVSGGSPPEGSTRPATEPPRPSKRRLKSLDAFRGSV